jgi:hypothetical protein
VQHARRAGLPSVESTIIVDHVVGTSGYEGNGFWAASI